MPGRKHSKSLAVITKTSAVELKPITVQIESI